MHRSFVFGFSLTMLLAADTKLAFNGLPAAVQASARTDANGAQIVGASKEIENGRTTYEVETKKDGKSRDLSYDPSGKLLEVEQEVELVTIPAAPQAALRTRAAGGVIKKLESVTVGQSVTYEAEVITKRGRHKEFAVNADGTRRRH